MTSNDWGATIPTDERKTRVGFYGFSCGFESRRKNKNARKNENGRMDVNVCVRVRARENLDPCLNHYDHYCFGTVLNFLFRKAQTRVLIGWVGEKTKTLIMPDLCFWIKVRFWRLLLLELLSLLIVCIRCYRNKRKWIALPYVKCEQSSTMMDS